MTLAKAAGSSAAPGWVALAGLALVASVNPFGCGTAPDDDDGLDPGAVKDVLAAVGPEVVIPTVYGFQTRVDQLEDAIEDWRVAAESGGDTSAARAVAQNAFAAAMEIWQQAEVHQIGPAGSSLTAVDGQDLRDEIYSWPTINPCRVDQETVEGDWDDADFFQVNLVNSYGLDALEHVLFAGPDNACPGQIDINADGTWDALGADGLEINRAQFAAALASDVSDRADELLGAWEGGYDKLFAETGQEGLNAVYDALFYLETATKDGKLTDLSPEDVEGVEAGDSVERIRANLVGFKILFTGGSGQGLDDLLEEVGHGDLATSILADTDAAIALTETLANPIDALLVSDPEAVTGLHDAVKQITDAVKGDLATVLTLQIPSEAAGDAD